MLDDDLLPCHTERTLTQRDGSNHRQEFWCQANGKRDREQEGIKRRSVKSQIDHKDEEDEKDNRAHNKEAKAAQTTVEFSLWRAGCQPRDVIAKGGRGASSNNKRVSSATHH